MGRRYCFETVLEAVPERGGAYVRFPYDLRQEKRHQVSQAAS